ncbi:hypothetical protein [Verminephrobacter eiseniae]|nr:hypothetical protein [Verminephrobacter eiseniae]
MISRDPSLRLRPWASLTLFLSSYSPLMLILVIKDYAQVNPSWLPCHPILSGVLLSVAIFSIVITLCSMKEISGGLPVIVIKASNKSGDMFGYTIPYMLSFLRIDLGDWRTMTSLLIFMAMLFVMAYRTQTVFINPILAMTGYMLIDCTFKHNDKEETQAMVITKKPISKGDSCKLERISHYLYIAVQSK